MLQEHVVSDCQPGDSTHAFFHFNNAWSKAERLPCLKVGLYHHTADHTVTWQISAVGTQMHGIFAYLALPLLHNAPPRQWLSQG